MLYFFDEIDRQCDKYLKIYVLRVARTRRWVHIICNKKSSLPAGEYIYTYLFNGRYTFGYKARFYLKNY